MKRKYSGILKECSEQPDGDLAVFLGDRLGVPLDKAEVLAARIRKEHRQTGNVQVGVRRILEKNPKTDVAAKVAAYTVGCLSQKEFGVFVQWMLEELGYEIQSRCAVDGGVDFVVALNGEKVAVLARKYPVSHAVSEAIFLVSQQAQCTHGCSRTILIATTQFTDGAAAEAQRLGVELWGSDVLAAKIVEAKQCARKIEQATLPPYGGSLLRSLLALGEAKIFLVERKSEGKYDVILPGVRYPLLTFEVDMEVVVRCVFRIKYNEPVPESNGEQIVGTDENGSRLGPKEQQAYEAITTYLSQFLE
jgi:HJR/Mrr/RecB family endonuclease